MDHTQDINTLDIDAQTDRPEFDRPPFYRKHLQSNDNILSIRLNEAERKQLTYIKNILRFEADGTALKVCLEIAVNVLHNTFNDDLLRYISDARRVRPGPK